MIKDHPAMLFKEKYFDDGLWNMSIIFGFVERLNSVVS